MAEAWSGTWHGSGNSAQQVFPAPGIEQRAGISPSAATSRGGSSKNPLVVSYFDIGARSCARAALCSRLLRPPCRRGPIRSTLVDIRSDYVTQCHTLSRRHADGVPGGCGSGRRRDGEPGGREGRSGSRHGAGVRPAKGPDEGAPLFIEAG
jgi:hypothetical protein